MRPGNRDGSVPDADLGRPGARNLGRAVSGWVTSGVDVAASAAMSFTSLRHRFPGCSDGWARFDGPAGTQVVDTAITAMTAWLSDGSNGCGGGYFAAAQRADELVDRTRATVGRLFNAPADGVTFGPNMTTLTFMMARVLGPLFEPGDEIITTHMEHDGNNTPWRRMAEDHGLVVKTLPWSRDTYEFDLDELDALITPRTKFASLNYASNILGTINPVPQMVARLKAAGAITYVDAVQYAPHGPIDVQALGCDFLVSSSYKFYGPHQGVLWGRGALLDQLRAFKLRVVPDVAPDKFETGCQSLEGQAGVIGAIEYLQWLGTTMGSPHLHEHPGVPRRTAEIHAAMAAMAEYEYALSGRLIAGLQAIDGVQVHGITDPASFERRVPTVSFSRVDTQPSDVAGFLDQHGVYVWNGHNYALPVIEWLGLAELGGVVRIGPTHYNTLAEVDRAVELVAEFVAAH